MGSPLEVLIAVPAQDRPPGFGSAADATFRWDPGDYFAKQLLLVSVHLPNRSRCIADRPLRCTYHGASAPALHNLTDVWLSV